MDHLGIIDRKDGLKPFLLLDGQGSRFELLFLCYINNPQHEWATCIGVPYGTDLWQVGDTEQQNGTFKARLAQAKENLMEKRKKSLLPMELVPTDIIPLLNYTWKYSSAQVETNKKAIYERGWHPYNRNLLLYPELTTTMTKRDRIFAGVNNLHGPQKIFEFKFF